MASRKPARKKPAPRRARLNVDPGRLALAALERIKTALARTGKLDRLGEAAPPRELTARAGILRQPLPPSYEAALRVAGTLGDRVVLLDADAIRRHRDEIARAGGDADRYVPFAEVPANGDPPHLACFDRQVQESAGELTVVEWNGSAIRFLAPHFGEWLDTLADEREEELERSASIPAGLKKLLVQLGFSFDDPILGRLETGDVAAIETLLGKTQTRAVRGDVDRLFDSSGKASVTLNLDEFSLAVSLRTGIFVLEAEDVFRWLRFFRDENFFGEAQRSPGHPDQVRDLRLAPREPPLVQRGVTEMPVMPARRHLFRAASGHGPDDFYLLARTHSTAAVGRAVSLIVHVVNGQLRDSIPVDEALSDLYVTDDGTIWALSHGGALMRFDIGPPQRFPLVRPGRGRPAWYGVGAGGRRVLVWGMGALLQLQGEEMLPFTPDAGLEPEEAVVAACSTGSELALLVCGDHVGAVARFDGRRWLPIGDDQVIDTALVDLDVWRGVALVLAKDRRVFRAEGDAPPRPVRWDRRQEAFLHQGVPRPLHAVRAVEGGALLASDGGVIAVLGTQAVFHAAPNAPQEPARIMRLMHDAVVATCGPNLWVWRGGAFHVLDLRQF